MMGEVGLHVHDRHRRLDDRRLGKALAKSQDGEYGEQSDQLTCVWRACEARVEDLE